MATHSKKIKWLDLCAIALFAGVLTASPRARSASLGGGTIVEDFTTDTYADYAATTGLWSLPDGKARAGVVVDAATFGAAKSVSFGDGSDGALNASTGVTLDTTNRANGFNFTSVNILGGTVTVTGPNPLIIRSLTTVNIGAGVTFSVKGNSGTNGSLPPATTGGAGGVAGGLSTATCGSANGGNGGAGGGATGASVSNGSDGSLADGTPDAATGGAGQFTAAHGADASPPPPPGAPPAVPDFEGAAFLCGSGGGGGGGNSDNTGNWATGAGGGAGGGRVRIASVGNVAINATIDASGGQAGRGEHDDPNNICSGSGAGGSGGVVWLQSLHTVAAVAPNVAAGLGNADVCNGVPGVAVDGNPGFFREDEAGAASTDTTLAAANQTYTIQSKAYDLGTLNAGFSGSPSVESSTTGGGSVSLEYAGSTDSASFSGFTSDITQLSGKGYRYLKFRIAIRTATTVAASPEVRKITVRFTDTPLETLDLKLSAGCGTLTGIHGGDAGSGSGSSGLPVTAGWLGFWILAYRFMRYGFVRRFRRLPTIELPAGS